MASDDYRIALRDDDDDALDDVVVKDVAMFRAERLSKRDLWMACYFPGTDQRITFHVQAKKGRLEFQFTESPHGPEFIYEGDDDRGE